MKHYKDKSGEFYGIPKGHDVPEDYVEVTLEEIESANKAAANAALKKLPYDELRRLEYPPIADFVDAYVKGDQTAIDEYVAACLAVKEKYPKS